MFFIVKFLCWYVPFHALHIVPSSSKGRLNLFKAGKVRGKMTCPWLSWKRFLLVRPWWPGRAEPLTSVETEEALVAHDLLEAVKAVLVHQLIHEGTWRTLVLHAGLHQVDGVHGGGTHGCHERKFVTIWKSKTVKRDVHLRGLMKDTSNNNKKRPDGKKVRIFLQNTSVNSYLTTLGWTQREYSTDRLN